MRVLSRMEKITTEQQSAAYVKAHPMATHKQLVALTERDGHDLLAVFHSHLSSPPRPSRTDVENIGLWEGRPYVILTVRSGDLAAWRIRDGRIEPLDLTG